MGKPKPDGDLRRDPDAVFLERVGEFATASGQRRFIGIVVRPDGLLVTAPSWAVGFRKILFRRLEKACLKAVREHVYFEVAGGRPEQAAEPLKVVEVPGAAVEARA